MATKKKTKPKTITIVFTKELVEDLFNGDTAIIDNAMADFCADNDPTYEYEKFVTRLTNLGNFRKAIYTFMNWK